MNRANLIITDSFLTQLNKYNAEKESSSPVAVVVRGKYDATGALGSAMQSLILQIAKTHRVAVRVIEDASNFGKSIRDACSGFEKKASILVVMSHGRSDYFKLGEDIPWYRFGWMSKPLYRREHIAPEDFSLLELNAKIVLLSCSSGRGIAKAISDASGRVVFAPMGFLYGVETCLQNWPNPDVTVLSFNENKKQHMGIFDPKFSSASIPSIDVGSEETKESFSAMEAYLRRKAEEGDSDAQLELGSFYLLLQGGCKKSERDAVYWISLAAEDGHARAQCTMGYLYLSGQGGIEKSDVKAIEWFQRSADQESPLALFQMGMCFYHGQLGLSQSDEEAYKFFSRAARNRMPQADYYLGLMYEYGRGVQRSLKHAKEHYKIAEDFEILDAKFRLSNLLFQEEQQLLGNRYLLNRVYLLVMERLTQISEFVSCFSLRNRCLDFARTAHIPFRLA